MRTYGLVVRALVGFQEARVVVLFNNKYKTTLKLNLRNTKQNLLIGIRTYVYTYYTYNITLHVLQIVIIYDYEAFIS